MSELREQKYFRAAALIAVNIYIQIHDGSWNPETGGSASAEANLSEAELKKLKSKKKKGRRSFLFSIFMNEYIFSIMLSLFISHDGIYW